MDSIEMMDKDLITDEALEKVSGGAGMTPPLPGFRRHHRMDPDLIKDEPKGGGATGSW
ncbi:MAG: hypothetical protein IKI84_02490 [Clostridia bacterium]|nr:hypothetical protein [Lachnospiraceae bacterium]MBR6705534.1 hypothetical protein [Clostridia bacterium]